MNTIDEKPTTTKQTKEEELEEIARKMAMMFMLFE
jgi:hypothetical protein